jgi:hypothetical protein
MEPMSKQGCPSVSQVNQNIWPLTKIFGPTWAYLTFACKANTRAGQLERYQLQSFKHNFIMLLFEIIAICNILKSNSVTSTKWSCHKRLAIIKIPKSSTLVVLLPYWSVNRMFQSCLFIFQRFMNLLIKCND